jgi:hypothetical protein
VTLCTFTPLIHPYCGVRKDAYRHIRQSFVLPQTLVFPPSSVTPIQIGFGVRPDECRRPIYIGTSSTLGPHIAAHDDIALPKGDRHLDFGWCDARCSVHVVCPRATHNILPHQTLDSSAANRPASTSYSHGGTDTGKRVGIRIQEMPLYTSEPSVICTALAKPMYI